MKELLERLVLCVDRLRDDQEPEIIAHDIECAWERNSGECNCSAINVDALRKWAQHAATTTGQTPELIAAKATMKTAGDAFWDEVRLCTTTTLHRSCECTERYADAINAAIAYGAAKLQEEQEAMWPSEDEVDTELRAAGLDPVAVGEHGLRLATVIRENQDLKQLVERLEWHLRRKHNSLAVTVKNERDVVDALLAKAREALR